MLIELWSQQLYQLLLWGGQNGSSFLRTLPPAKTFEVKNIVYSLFKINLNSSLPSESPCISASFLQLLSTATGTSYTMTNSSVIKFLKFFNISYSRDWSGKVDGGQFGLRSHNLAERRAVARDKVDDTVRKPSIPEYLVYQVVWQNGGVARLPHDAVALRSNNRMWSLKSKKLALESYHNARRICEVAGNGCEVEWRDRRHKSLQRPVPHQIESSVGILTDRLVLEQLFSKVAVKPGQFVNITGGRQNT